jgi:hypothetical protein
MVRALSSITRDRARAVGIGTMADECQYITTSAQAPNSSGYVARTPAAPVTSMCGLQLLATRDQYTVQGAGDTSSVLVVAMIRLPLALYGTVKATSRITITKRWGETLSVPEQYEIVGSPRRGAVALVADLRKVTL